MSKGYIETLLENEEVKTFVEKHETLINEAVVATQDYSKTLKSFVLENFEEFVGENIEQTYKNIRLFSEVATMTFMNEAIHLQAQQLEVKQEEEKKIEEGINEYL